MSLSGFRPRSHGAPAAQIPAPAPETPETGVTPPQEQDPPVDPDVPMEQDEGSFELAETSKIRIVEAKGLPFGDRLAEKDACYDAQYTGLITGQYRGKDEPPHGKGSGGRFFTDETPVSVICMDPPSDLPPPQLNVSPVWQDDLKAKVKDAMVTMKWHLNSQHPAMILRIKRDDEGQDIFVHLFTDNLRRTIQADGDWRTSLALHTSSSSFMATALARAGEQTRTHAANGDICALVLSLWSVSNHQNEPDPGNHGKLPKCRPLVTGISTTELEAIEDKFFANAAACKDWERLVIGLYSANADYTFARYWPAKDSKIATDFWNWYRQATNCVAYWGSHWVYSQQLCVEEGEDIYDAQFDVSKLVIPRHMVKKWRVDENDNVLGVAECAQFRVAPFYAQSGSFPFELKVGIERERAWTSRILKAWLSTRRDWTITARLTQDPAHPEFWMCCLKAKVEPALLPTDTTVRPTLKARIKVNVKADGVQHTLVGQLCEDLFERFGLSGELACYLRTEGALSSGVEPGEILELDCNAEFIDDPTPADRYIAAVDKLQDALAGDHARVKGIDSPFLFLRSLPKIKSQNQDSLAKELEHVADGRLAFDAVLRDRGLNEMQMQAARNSRDSKTGITAVRGPPGTGKTHLAASVLEAHVRAGHATRKKRQCLVTAPFNAAVDVLASKFLDGLRSTHRKFYAVRFTDGLSKPLKAHNQDLGMMDAGEDPASKRERTIRERLVGALEEGANVAAAEMDAKMEASFWELIATEAKPLQKEKHAAMGYLEARKEWENTVLAHVGQHPMRYKIIAFRNKIPPSGGKSEKSIETALKELEDELDAYFLGNVVDVVFCTNSTAAHPKLLDNFKPRVLLIDEAAISTIVDSITPIAAFVDTGEHVFLMGDDYQQGTREVAKKANEFSSAYGLSIFQFVWNNEHIENSKIVLNMQHRAHPTLVDLTSQLFYPQLEGGLISHPAVARENGKWNTLQAMLERMGPAYAEHKPRRLFIDVSQYQASGEKQLRMAYATQAKSSTSWQNEMEARTIVSFIMEACAMESVCGEPMRWRRLKVEQAENIVKRPSSKL
ncbi:hypothetical protein BST61_g6909 [Cercospora zeina]